ncbi:folate-binding protein [Mesorhizobium sp. NBSH29]|uniref:CAF17-like 4Fe-4S cluster assembly/insertion protein YgfZ n=1 Tax=Mesorhizobium sp. NBSH29 TaxID=2654249 RepID=UPI0018965B63|nr:folate-binding protein YgfZ [Mesorhizobium sp. NBSH29]QPC87280.1 folate-binding protein [Mesorhizobium sp. NBSH29]
MPSAALTDRALILVSGPDAWHFLQNIVTTDLDALAHGVARPGALLSPQGKILFDFLISRDGDSLRLDCRADVADDFRRRLMIYKLRAKVDISESEQCFVGVVWDSESTSSETDSGTVRDMRFELPVYRSYGFAIEGDRAGFDALRVARGVAESGSDYVLGDAFPHDVLLDQMDGVGFKKGCYVGQEVVSRMQHRGTARRRVLIAVSDEELPPSGAEITASGRALGTLGTVAGNTALAVARIDRVKDAMDAGVPLVAGNISLSLSIPRFARFTFPAGTVSGLPDA